MKPSLQLAITTAVLMATVAAPADEKKAQTVYTGKLSSLGISGGALESDWTGPTGLLIDDFEDLDHFPAPVRKMAEELKRQTSPIGVIAMADFTYRRKSNALDQLTLRAFVFDSEKSCADWWEKKYRHPGWEKYYKVVEDVPYRGVDSTELPKRAVSIGNVWMTCGSTKKSENHLKLLDLYIRRFNDPEAPDKPGRRSDKTGEFSYDLPAGWKVVAVGILPHDMVMLPEADGIKRNIYISDQGRESSLAKLKAKYDRRLPKAFRDFKLVESKLVELRDQGSAALIIHTNSNPGIPVRQVNYIVDVGAKRYFVCGTVSAADGAKFDRQISDFVASMKAAD